MIEVAIGIIQVINCIRPSSTLLENEYRNQSGQLLPVKNHNRAVRKTFKSTETEHGLRNRREF